MGDKKRMRRMMNREDDAMIRAARNIADAMRQGFDKIAEAMKE